MILVPVVDVVRKQMSMFNTAYRVGTICIYVQYEFYLIFRHCVFIYTWHSGICTAMWGLL